MKVDEIVSDRILMVVNHTALLQQIEALQLIELDSKISDKNCSEFQSLYSQGRI